VPTCTGTHRNYRLASGWTDAGDCPNIAMERHRRGNHNATPAAWRGGNSPRVMRIAKEEAA
jgi:hypothetical protein